MDFIELRIGEELGDGWGIEDSVGHDGYVAFIIAVTCDDIECDCEWCRAIERSDDVECIGYDRRGSS